MAPSTRVRLIVATVAVAAMALVSGVVYATAQRPAQVKAQCSFRPQPLVVPGVRSTHVAAVRAALKEPAKAAAQTLEPIARVATNDPVVQFNYGSVLWCAGYLNEAEQAYLAAKKSGRDTYYEMKADIILHPQYFKPADGLYPRPEIDTKNPLLIQGELMQRQGHQHSAAKLYAKAAKLNPSDDQAQVAAAVGLFDESNLVPAFSHLGPLVQRFPKSQAVRFNLGLLLAWTGQSKQAVKEFRLARALGPQTDLGKEADAFLKATR
jgi:tetratricopeptide (TPR) repeat protein